MFERLIKTLIRTIANTFFRRVDVVGIRNVPAEGPVIFAGNHPNALMDGWLLTARCGRWPLRFMASAKLWRYPFLGRALNAMGAVPVYPRSEFGVRADNGPAFDQLYEVIEAGDCVGVFPEGVSHAESQLAELKTGTARIALTVASRGKATVSLVPVGLNYINRHRFRSQVLIEFGEPIAIDDAWLADFRADEDATVRRLTDRLAKSLAEVTLNAPDWRTLRFVQAARRLYKPDRVNLTPGQYVELNRRFVEAYMRAGDDAEMRRFRDDVEEYEAHLELLGFRDHQLRKPVAPGPAYRRILLRSMRMLVLMPLAIPGALLHLPVGWTAAAVGERFSYEMDDIATLKVFATVALLPVIYLGIGLWVGSEFGWPWGVITVVGLTVSFSASVWLLETQASLYISVMSLFKLARLSEEVETLRATRAKLVTEVRKLADRLADPGKPRIFTNEDFA